MERAKKYKGKIFELYRISMRNKIGIDIKDYEGRVKFYKRDFIKCYQKIKSL